MVDKSRLRDYLVIGAVTLAGYSTRCDKVYFASVSLKPVCGSRAVDDGTPETTIVSVDQYEMRRFLGIQFKPDLVNHIEARCSCDQFVFASDNVDEDEESALLLIGDCEEILDDRTRSHLKF